MSIYTFRTKQFFVCSASLLFSFFFLYLLCVYTLYTNVSIFFRTMRVKWNNNIKYRAPNEIKNTNTYFILVSEYGWAVGWGKLKERTEGGVCSNRRNRKTENRKKMKNNVARAFVMLFAIRLFLSLSLLVVYFCAYFAPSLLLRNNDNNNSSRSTKSSPWKSMTNGNLAVFSANGFFLCLFCPIKPQSDVFVFMRV